MVKAAKNPVALSGTAAGYSSIRVVGTIGNDLYYRGHHISGLAKSATVEEIACLLIFGALPGNL